MKRILFLVFSLISCLSFGQTSQSDKLIRNAITPRYFNGIVKQGTIAQLRAMSPNIADLSTTYFCTEAGKEGLFKADFSDNSTLDNGATCIISNSIRIKRIIQNEVFSEWFGSVGNGINDDTESIQNAINFCSLNKYNLKLNAKNYLVSSLYFKNCNISGTKNKTKLIAKASNEISFVKFGDPVISGVEWKDFDLVGNVNNTNQSGFVFIAYPQTIPAYTGGLWYSKFTNITISGFSKDQIHFEADDNFDNIQGNDIANQFLTFENVVAIHKNSSSSRSLYAKGQFGQIRFVDCEFDGEETPVFALNSTSVELVSLQVESDNVYAVSFYNTTFQHSETAIKLKVATKGVSVDNCYFERLTTGALLDNSSSIYITNSTFGNVGASSLTDSFAEGEGAIIEAKNNSFFFFDRNTIRGSVDFMLIGREYGGCFIGSNSTTNNKTKGLTKQIRIVNENIYSYSHSNMILYADSPTVLKNINSDLSTSNRLICRVFGNGTIEVNQLGNIETRSINNPVFKNGDVMIFEKNDLLGIWVLVSSPKPYIANATLSNGVATITTTASTTNSLVYPVTKTISGTHAAGGYTYDVSTAGTVVITARKADGTIETGCNSTVTYQIIN